jgi:UDP:flavonoid glycosyltransferase YjiC (YdhE family)
MVGLGWALRQRGHDVAIVANPYFDDEIAVAGLEFVPLGMRDEYEELSQHPDLWHWRRGIKLIFRHAAKYLRALYAIVNEQIDRGTSVLAAHGLDLASRVAGERYHVPVASINFAPQAFWSEQLSPKIAGTLTGPAVPRWLKRAQFTLGERLVLEPIVGPVLNQLRRDEGLPPVQRIFSSWWHATDAVLGLFPAWFAPPQPDWPPNTKLVGFPLWDGGRKREMPKEVNKFLEDGTPPIVFTPGSAHRAAEDFFQTAAAACVKLGRRGVLLTKYAEQLPRSLPADVRHFGFVPLSHLLPRAAAFVHHGGIGSCAQGLAAGIPQIIRPLAYDQFDNAARLVRLGVAREISVRRFRTANVAKSLGELISSSSQVARCRELAIRCDGSQALSSACAELEKLAETWGKAASNRQLVRSASVEDRL